MVQQRIFNTSPEKSFVFKTTEDARDFLLKEGTDLKYGARHLKRAIERLLVQPMSNLIATDQVRGGDCVNVDFDARRQRVGLRQGSRGLPFTPWPIWSIARSRSQPSPWPTER